jgi:hypothetical protein
VTLLIFRARSSSFKGIPPAVSFCPPDLTAPNKSHSPSLCHPDRSEPGFPATRHSPTTACAAFSKESRMNLANATKLDRKSGVAQWRDLQFAQSASDPGGRSTIFSLTGRSVPLQRCRGLAGTVANSPGRPFHSVAARCADPAAPVHPGPPGSGSVAQSPASE